GETWLGASSEASLLLRGTWTPMAIPTSSSEHSSTPTLKRKKAKPSSFRETPPLIYRQLCPSGRLSSMSRAPSSAPRLLEGAMSTETVLATSWSDHVLPPRVSRRGEGPIFTSVTAAPGSTGGPTSNERRRR